MKAMVARTPRYLAKLWQVLRSFSAAVAGLLVLALMLLVFSDVVLRYLFNRPVTGALEVSQYMLVYITFLALGWILSVRGHVTMDLLSARIRAKAKNNYYDVALDILGLFYSATFIWLSGGEVWRLYQEKVTMMGDIVVPQFAVWIAIPLGFVLLFLQQCADLWGHLSQTRGIQRPQGQ